MSRGSKKKHQSQKRVPPPELTPEELDAFEREVGDEMFDPEDAEDFRLARIDDIGSK
jgi:hypothetical protein